MLQNKLFLLLAIFFTVQTLTFAALVCYKCEGDTCLDKSTMDPETCPSSNYFCFTEINSNGELSRGCRSSEDACTGDLCKKCEDDDKCNDFVFPENRLKCYQCNDENCKETTALVSKQLSKQCRLYKADDKCYSYAENDKKMTRGCVSDPDTTVNKCSGDQPDPKCAICDGMACNSKTYLYKPELKCHQCSGANCEKAQIVGKETSCDSLVPYNKNEECYTETKNGITRRGCLYKDSKSDTTVCTSSNTCTHCATDGCNKEIAERFSCIICKSLTKPDCENNAAKLDGTDCGKAVDEEDKKCFHGVWNNIVKRDCWSNANEEEKQSCSQQPNDNKCTVCKTENCNNAKTSGAASNILSTAGILATIAVITLSMRNPSK